MLPFLSARVRLLQEDVYNAAPSVSGAVMRHVVQRVQLQEVHVQTAQRRDQVSYAPSLCQSARIDAIERAWNGCVGCAGEEARWYVRSHANQDLCGGFIRFSVNVSV